MNQNKSLICAALYGAACHEIIDQAARLISLVDLFEIRVDLMKQPDIKGCIDFIAKPLLFTNRPEWEGGKYQGKEDDRLNSLYEAINLEAAYIDIELKTDPKLRDMLINKAKGSMTKVVVSNHNFETTPSSDVLNGILEEMIQSGADIGKIITTANSPADSARILALLDTAQKNDFSLTAFAMGEYGRITRFATLFLGGCMSYVASESSQETASGQFTAEQLATLIHQFNHAHEY